MIHKGVETKKDTDGKEWMRIGETVFPRASRYPMIAAKDRNGTWRKENVYLVSLGRSVWF